MQEAQRPSVGRIVHYVLPDGPSAGAHRPAIIVRVWSAQCVQLQVFTDGSNDGPGYKSGLVWRTSVLLGLDENTWHWPEFVGPGVAPAGAPAMATMATMATTR